MKRAWVCDSCNRPHSEMPWACPGCGKETCENCFDRFGHCKPCCEGKSDEELRVAANNSGDFAFEPPMASDDTFKPDWVSPPGDTIIAILEEQRISREEFAKAIRWAHGDVNDLLCGRAAITPDLASQLAEILGSTASFWMKREARYRQLLRSLRRW